MGTQGRSALSDKSIKTLFIGKCWEYLDSNFHKFSQGNRIKIALELCKKDIPQVLEGEVKYTEMKRIVIEDRRQPLDLGEDIPEKIKERVNDRHPQNT